MFEVWNISWKHQVEFPPLLEPNFVVSKYNSLCHILCKEEQISKKCCIFGFFSVNALCSEEGVAPHKGGNSKV